MPFREGYGAGEIDLVEFTEILIKALRPVDLDQILIEISNRYEHGCCPICGSAEAPHDKDGKPLPHGADVSNAEMHEMHEVDCFVTLIEEMRSLKPVEC
ncbi:MAG TPA: hypothetical protein VHV10_15520 [Ktedonobacteraceae bacterium]|jgi:hypothetical protein|nr:hypothetical protein [Ktedonobacteraceae bacterium]